MKNVGTFYSIIQCLKKNISHIIGQSNRERKIRAKITRIDLLAIKIILDYMQDQKIECV